MIRNFSNGSGNTGKTPYHVDRADEDLVATMVPRPGVGPNGAAQPRAY